MIGIIYFLSLLQLALAQFHIGANKAAYSAGDTMEVSWTKPDNSVKKLGSLDQGQLLLCTCNTTGKFGCQSLKEGIPIQKVDSTSIELTPNVTSLGPDGLYTLQFSVVDSKNAKWYGQSYLQGSIKLSGMTGSGKANLDCSVPTDDYPNVPGTASSKSISWPAFTLPQSLQHVSSYDIPYTWQKGPTRVAPFQRTPGTKVTVTTTPSRRYPSSSYSAYSTYVFTRMPMTTLTPGPSSSAIQQANFAATIATTPSGKKPVRQQPTLVRMTASTSSRHKRWAD